MMTELEKYYNKFNEEKRLGSRHGQVEFTTSMKSWDLKKEKQFCKSLSGKCNETFPLSE